MPCTASGHLLRQWPGAAATVGMQCTVCMVGAPLVVSAMNVVLDVVTMPMTPDQQWWQPAGEASGCAV